MATAVPPGHVLEAAVRGDAAAQVDLALYYRDRNDRFRALRWAKRAALSGSRKGQSLLADVNPRAFKRATRPLWSESMTGSMVRLSGYLVPQTEGWDGRIVIARRHGQRVVLTGETKGMQAGRYVIAYGRKRSVGVEVMLWEAPAPRYRYRYRLIPNGVAGGSSQVYTVEMTVANVGRQPIKTLDLGVRFRQQQSPNDETKTASIGPLDPGTLRRVHVSVTFFNHRHSGRSSVPRVTVREKRLEW
ncbi:MAG: hypothetical protein GY715_04630 [Planctomycetes bacterium]|nr:hypothetical protein [Planctomycetota bacterium]